MVKALWRAVIRTRGVDEQATVLHDGLHHHVLRRVSLHSHRRLLSFTTRLREKEPRAAPSYSSLRGFIPLAVPSLVRGVLGLFRLPRDDLGDAGAVHLVHAQEVAVEADLVAYLGGATQVAED